MIYKVLTLTPFSDRHIREKNGFLKVELLLESLIEIEPVLIEFTQIHLSV